MPSTGRASPARRSCATPTAASTLSLHPAHAPETGCRPTAWTITCSCFGSTTRRSASPLVRPARRPCPPSCNHALERKVRESVVMIRWLLWLLAGALLGGIVHLIAVLILPRTATQDAYSRLTPITPVNAVAPIPHPSPQNELLPFMAPAFASAVCRYDLSAAPIKLSV